MKPEAKIKYEEVLNGMDHTDVDCGIFLHSEFCFISATPDLTFVLRFGHCENKMSSNYC